MARNPLIWILGLSSIDYVFQQTISPALPTLQARLHTSATAVVWVLTAFLLTGIGAIACAGPVGDRYGRRRALLVSLGLFTAGSVVCAASSSLVLLIVGRLIQGLGAGLSALAIAIVREQFPPHVVPRAIGFLIGAAGLGGIVGTLLTGVLVAEVSVESLFWVLAGFSALLMVGVLRWVDVTPRHRETPIDWPSASLLALAVAALMLGISEANTWGWGSWRELALAAAFAGLLVALARRQARVRHPLIDASVLRRRPIWSANLVGVLYGMFFNGVTLASLIAGYPRSTGYGLGLSSIRIAVMLVPFGVGSLVGGLASGRLVLSLGSRRTSLAGGAAVVLSGALLLALPWTAVDLAISLLPLGLGTTVIGGAIIDVITASTSARSVGEAAAVNAALRTIGLGLGPQIAVAVALTTSGLTPGLPSRAGFSDAFVFDVIVAAIASVALVIMPGRDVDPIAVARQAPAPSD